MQLETISELSEQDWIRVERELSARSLSEFIKLAWHIIEPGAQYVHGWHIDAIAEHLQAVTDGQITRLLINCPPGMMKSLLVGVFWPMWEWGPRNQPHLRYLAGSHSQGFAMRDNLRSRRLCFSDWYQKRWRVGIAPDQDTKMKFENIHTGWRAAAAMSSMTGERGDRVIIDDPHSVEGSLSDVERATTLRIFQETVSTRLNNQEKSAVIVIMQRLHQEDVSGHILSEELGYTHLNLPMRFEADRKCVSSIGFEDPRKEDGELLFPERYSEEGTQQIEKELGGTESAAVAGQLQQRPVPRGGLMFHVGKIQIVGAIPAKLIRHTRYWDKAGTQDGGKRTAGVLIAYEPTERLWYVLDVVKGQWEASGREQRIEQVARLDGPRVKVYVEQEPGSGGKESAENTVKNLAGVPVEAERPTGDKALRAEPFSCQVNAGNVRVVEAEWNKDYLQELENFPLGKFKDQVDASSGAFNKIASTGSSLAAMTKLKSSMGIR